MKKNNYDYLVVGAGLAGSVAAHELNKKGYKVLVIDKNDHIGGNCYTMKVGNIDVHKYGAHIFHTNNKDIWEYVNQFVEFNNYINSPIANYKGELYNLPFNMNTFNKLWGVVTPEEAQQKIESQKCNNINPQNLEEQALNLVGRDIYNKLIKGYTEKQWGKDCKELPPEIIKRLPVRLTYDNNYFNDRYQGIPINGYTELFEKLLDGIEVKLNTNYFYDREYYNNIANKIIFTGPIDAYYNHKFGKLEYRSLKFIHKAEEIENYQGVAVMNFTDRETPYTRIIEHRHFNKCDSDFTIITKEYPAKTGDPYYPINNFRNNNIYSIYKREAEKDNNVIFIGRLGLYKYFDMDDTIEATLDIIRGL